MGLLSETRFKAEKLLGIAHALFSFLVALGSELLQFLSLSADGFWLFRPKHAKATFSAMQSLADPAKAACAGSGDGKSTWMRLSSK